MRTADPAAKPMRVDLFTTLPNAFLPHPSRLPIVPRHGRLPARPRLRKRTDNHARFPGHARLACSDSRAFGLGLWVCGSSEYGPIYKGFAAAFRSGTRRDPAEAPPRRGTVAL